MVCGRCLLRATAPQPATTSMRLHRSRRGAPRLWHRLVVPPAPGLPGAGRTQAPSVSAGWSTSRTGPPRARRWRTPGSPCTRAAVAHTRHACMPWGARALAGAGVSPLQRNDAGGVSLAADDGAPLAGRECRASGSPQSAPGAGSPHGPVSVESAVARFPYRSVRGRHSLSEFLLACVSFPSENGRHSSPQALRFPTIP
jgi:hypothetical protein